jgi:hypothetical protein
MVPCMVSAKERDCVLQRPRRYWLEGTHILRVWKDGNVRIIPIQPRKGILCGMPMRSWGIFCS